MSREDSQPGRLHTRLEPSVRRRKAFVHLDPGAAADVIGVLQGVQKHTNLARTRQRSNVSQLVARARFGGRHLEPGAGRASSSLDVGTSVGVLPVPIYLSAVFFVGDSGARTQIFGYG